MSGPLVLGLDGYPGGWACVALEGGAVIEARGLPTLEAVVDRFPGAVVIGIDMPFAFAQSGRRPADLAARSYLGRRAGSVFLMPPEPVLAATSHAEAVDLARSLNESAPSAQCFALFRKIHEARAAVVAGHPLFEVHPEVSFLALGEGAPLPRKKSWNGLRARLALLHGAGIAPGRCETDDVPADDLLDAAVAAWSADRIARGEALTLPAGPSPQERAANMLVWY